MPKLTRKQNVYRVAGRCTATVRTPKPVGLPSAAIIIDVEYPGKPGAKARKARYLSMVKGPAASDPVAFLGSPNDDTPHIVQDGMRLAAQRLADKQKRPITVAVDPAAPGGDKTALAFFSTMDGLKILRLFDMSQANNVADAVMAKQEAERARRAECWTVGDGESIGERTAGQRNEFLHHMKQTGRVTDEAVGGISREPSEYWSPPSFQPWRLDAETVISALNAMPFEKLAAEYKKAADAIPKPPRHFSAALYEDNIHADERKAITKFMEIADDIASAKFGVSFYRVEQ